MISILRLYSPSLVLTAWTVAWLFGVRSDEAIGFFLALTAMSLVLSEGERRKLLREVRAGALH
jgi:hypothetical protein